MANNLEPHPLRDQRVFLALTDPDYWHRRLGSQWCSETAHLQNH